MTTWKQLEPPIGWGVRPWGEPTESTEDAGVLIHQRRGWGNAKTHWADNDEDRA